MCPVLHRVTVDDIIADVLNDYAANGKRTRDHADRRWRLHLQPFFGGRRASEWRQVDWKAGTVRLDVGTTKNDAGRTFPFCAPGPA